MLTIHVNFWWKSARKKGSLLQGPKWWPCTYTRPPAVVATHGQTGLLGQLNAPDQSSVSRNVHTSWQAPDIVLRPRCRDEVGVRGAVARIRNWTHACELQNNVTRDMIKSANNYQRKNKLSFIKGFILCAKTTCNGRKKRHPGSSQCTANCRHSQHSLVRDTRSSHSDWNACKEVVKWIFDKKCFKQKYSPGMAFYSVQGYRVICFKVKRRHPIWHFFEKKKNKLVGPFLRCIQDTVSKLKVFHETRNISQNVALKAFFLQDRFLHEILIFYEVRATLGPTVNCTSVPGAGLAAIPASLTPPIC